MRMAHSTKKLLLSVLAVLALAAFAAPAMASEASGGGHAETTVGDHHAEGAQKEGGDVLKLMGSVMFWEYVTFGVVLVVLGVFIFPKLLKQLSDRHSRIQDALDKADKVRAEAEVLLKRHEDMMKRAHEDAKKITDDAVEAAGKIRQRMEQEAQTAASEIKTRAQKEIELSRKRVEAELRDTAIELALLASGRVLEKSLDDEQHRRLASEAIEASGLLKN